MSKNRDGLTRLARKRYGIERRKLRVRLVRSAGIPWETDDCCTDWCVYAFHHFSRIPRRFVAVAEKAINLENEEYAQCVGVNHTRLHFGWHKVLGGK